MRILRHPWQYFLLIWTYRAYPLASLGYAGWMLRHWGFKPVFIFGLCLYAIGAFMMWPATVYRSFGGFCGATFLCGSGLGSLETAANPYLAVCGPPRYSEIRINLAQAFNGIGSVVAPALASYVFFKDTTDSKHSLETVQWVYLAVGAFAFVLAFTFFLSHIPEITDADMEVQIVDTHASGADKPLRKQYRLFHAAFTQFCYCGAQGRFSFPHFSQSPANVLQCPSLHGSSITRPTPVLAPVRHLLPSCLQVPRQVSRSADSVVSGSCTSSDHERSSCSTWVVSASSLPLQPELVVMLVLVSILLFFEHMAKAQDTDNEIQPCFSSHSSLSRSASPPSLRLVSAASVDTASVVVDSSLEVSLVAAACLPSLERSPRYTMIPESQWWCRWPS